MKPLTRVRIILFALMIFGSFANFALNEWGNSLIIWCEIIMALSFLAEISLILFQRIKINNRVRLSKLMLGLIALFFLSIFATYFSVRFMHSAMEYIGYLFLISSLLLFVIIVIEALYNFFKRIDRVYIYENYFLFAFFTGMVFKNLAFPGASILLILSCAFLVPYFITSAAKFFSQNYKSAKQLVLLLTVGHFATIFLGLAFLFRTMHWPYATIMFYIAILFTFLMILGALKWKFRYYDKQINLLEGLRILKTHIILLFFMLFTFITYKFLVQQKLAPDFYSAQYPKQFQNLRNGSEADNQKAGEIREVYENFTQKAEKNGFLK